MSRRELGHDAKYPPSRVMMLDIAFATIIKRPIALQIQLALSFNVS